MRKLVLLLLVVAVIGVAAAAVVTKGAPGAVAPGVAREGKGSFAFQGKVGAQGAPSASPPVTERGSSTDSTAPPGAPAGAEDGSLIDRMVIYNANLTLVMKSVQDGISSVTEIAKRLGGSVIGTSTSYRNGEMLATVTLRVPSIAYSEAMEGLRRLGLRVESESSSGKDVSEEFTDLEARLRNLEATELQFLGLMKKATTIDEILKVQGRLTEVRGQIERTKGRMNYLQRSSDMATITVSMVPEGFSQARPLSGWDPEKAAKESWEASLKVLQSIALVAIRVAVFSWWLVPPLALLAIAVGLFRGRRGAYGAGQP